VSIVGLRRWEYKVIAKESSGFLHQDLLTVWQEEMNELGQQGWRLVGIVPTSFHRGNPSGAAWIFNRSLNRDYPFFVLTAFQLGLKCLSCLLNFRRRSPAGSGQH
jgi:hypothetical protein